MRAPRRTGTSARRVGAALLGLLLASCASLDQPPEPRPAACAEEEGSLDSRGKPTTRVEAEYPRAAMRMGKNGFVCMNFTVGVDGTVSDICVSEEQPRQLFDREAAEALAQWRFAPPREPFRSGTCVQFYMR